mgnify:CR=1 FL=1
MAIREDSILFLLGAGASVDAGIMHAKSMTNDIEEKIQNDDEFIKFKALYNYLKSSILYQRGLEGRFTEQDVGIEDLLNVLSELKQKHNNKLYPFIGGWNVHLLKVAGDDFENVTDLDKLIRKQLFKWINIKNYDDSNYFSSFGNLANEIGSAIRVFTLNYDLCVEKALTSTNTPLELGFNVDREWEATKFDVIENSDVRVFLYKLHGSIDWVREGGQEHILTKCDSPQDNPELIFGTTAKLSSVDPYLFYVHEFRKYSLEEQLRLIVTIGYSYSDDYINRLISQAVMKNEFVRVLTVFPTFEEKEQAKVLVENERHRIAKLLNIDVSKVIVEDFIAKEFFNENLDLSYFEKHTCTIDDSPF